MANVRKDIRTVEDWLGKDNEIGIDIWKKKYQTNGETFLEWVNRISGGNDEIKEMILQKKFLFAGRIMAGRGIQDGRKTSLSNCYVMQPPEDNLESIFDCASQMARTYSYGGGCGVDVSGLSPKGAVIRNAAKETSGAISFMELYDLTTKIIGQQGRRGALMISMSSNHPDIEEFINLKTDLNAATKANLSIRADGEFFKAIEEGKEYKLSYTREATGETISRMVDAKKLFHRMAETNWDFGEPGILFWDNISGWNLLSEDKNFSYAGTNPCAEEPLPAGGSCLLGSINLSEFVKNPFTKNAEFDMEAFGDCVMVCVKAMNDVLIEGIPRHPLQMQRDSVSQWRQIGLGIMGYADMLIKMGLRYGSEETLEMSRKIMQRMTAAAILKSVLMAVKDGAYPACDKEAVVKSAFFQAHKNAVNKLMDEYGWQVDDSKDIEEIVKEYGIANSQLLCIAPTGTISTMFGISGGMEPIFATHYKRKTESLHGKDVYYNMYTAIVKELMDKLGIDDVEKLPNYVITAPNIYYKNRIDTQAMFQHYIDASISSTVNVPNAFSVEDVENLYLYAHEKKLKGITLFRDGCKRAGILTSEDNKKKDEDKGERKTVGKKIKLTTGCGSLHMTAWFDADTGDFVEVFLNKGSSGGCNNFMNGLSRALSITSQYDVPFDAILDQLDSTGVCPSYAVRKATKGDTSPGSCCPMAVGKALKKLHEEVLAEINGEKLVEKETSAAKNKAVCPECGEPLAFEGGCNICKNCGWSKCE